MSKTSTLNSSIHSFSTDALQSDDMVALVQKLRSKEVSAHELVEAAIKRAELVNPRLNAIATPTYDLAREQLKSLPTEGFSVPFFIKDNHPARGAPVRYGSMAMPATIASKNSMLVDLFNSMGLLSIGKSNLSEFGLKPNTETPAHGTTHNPWNTSYSAGGSSGGSAALVAAGVAPIAHANDGGGSIRIPASCCGLVGLKPSRGRLKVDPVMLPINIVSEGVVTRSVRDTAAFYALAEKKYRNHSLKTIGDIRGPSDRRLKIGFFTVNPLNEPCHPEVVAVVNNAAALCREMGHSVEEIAAPFEASVLEHFFLYWGMLSFMVKSFGHLYFDDGFDKNNLERFTHELSDHFLKSTLSLPVSLFELFRFGFTYNKPFEKYDLLLSPTLGHPPAELGHLGPEVSFAETYARLSDYVPFTPYQNISGAPAVSLPLGQSREGLPIGVHFAAKMGDEKTLIELAYEIEEAVAFKRIDQAT